MTTSAAVSRGDKAFPVEKVAVPAAFKALTENPNAMKSMIRIAEEV